jgi:hypothetical protein
MAGSTVISATQGSDVIHALSDLNVSTYRTRYYNERTDSIVQMPNGRGSYEDAFRRLRSANKRGLQIRSQEPNSGTVQLVYDSTRDLKRFTQSSQQRHDGITSYVKYDEFNRIIEEGVIASAELIDETTLYATTTAQNNANNMSYPATSDSPNIFAVRTYGDDLNDLDNAGRLIDIKLYSYPGGALESEEKHSYNPFGNIVQYQISTLNDDGATFTNYTSAYVYDGLGRSIAIQYPTNFDYVIYYHYDLFSHIDRIMEQLDGGNINQIAAYTYTAYGKVLTETLALGDLGITTTTYTYNSPEWITSIDGPDMKETLTYTTGGYTSDGKNTGTYYSGKIASMAVELKTLPEGTKDNDGNPMAKTVQYNIAYDMSGRVKAAKCLSDGQEDTEWSFTDSIKYDDNGNIKTIGAYTASFETGTDRLIGLDDSSSDSEDVVQPDGPSYSL